MPEVEIDVLNAETEALEDTHAGAVEQQDHELRFALQARHYRGHLVAAEDGGQAFGLTRADHVVEPVEVGLEYVAVEEEDRGQRLPLGGNGHSTLLGEMGEEAVEVVAVEVARVAMMKLHVAAYSGGISLLGADGVMANTKLGTYPVEEPLRAPRRGLREGVSGGHLV